ncbi:MULTISPECIES: M48 family metallopeptidase [unclassified Paracoccus (in: a-proteobacteria)]|uniref:M48 family metallopeptidase n=1 Tax=unclassified Paracoccus (in: a-proteobacteria) TaxID=2688777 RepID=UPI0021E15596|nr:MULTISPECIES: SprT family zinc-dependent metalloprotease [unclassified Paracoccus (in: a-proteobacteria)]UXU74234.1 M48 family metallopeptidase [Paracoccus sp. SMMA_5]UXU82105.1 M48 family metallopeptidase [Paracoccus sp. SMMA_5_TC]
MDGFLVGGDIPVLLRRSARARRMTLRVTRAGGEVVLTLPSRTSLSDGRAFAESRADWLRRIRAEMPALRRIVPGAMLPVEGVLRRIAPTAEARLQLRPDALLLPQDRPAGVMVETWLRGLARDRLAAACDRHAAVLGRQFTALALRDTRSRWGSCTHDGRLMFSWRLVMAPPQVLDYVAAHEVAHLRHMDHSDAFWRTTAALLPGFEQPRAWLRRHGHELLTWRFRD